MSDSDRHDPAPERWSDCAGPGGDLGHYCNAHSYWFARGEVCRNCTEDPGPPIKVESSTVVDRDAVLAEAEVRQLARDTKKLSESLTSSGNEREIAVGLKAADTYLKAMRLWREMHAERMQAESDDRLREHDARMAGLRGSN